MNNYTHLHTFVIAAKFLSFTKAAQELFLSQGAVSVQIRQLETELGFKLFHRKIRKIYLTEEGKRLLEVAEPSFQNIQTRIESIRSTSKEGTLTVSTILSFAMKWLIPRLSEFQEEHPEIDFRLHTSIEHVDFIKEKIDCAIRFGLGNYPELYQQHITDEVYFPVCSPGLIRDGFPLQSVEDIQNYPIIHDLKNPPEFNINWNRWAETLELNHFDFDRGLTYDQTNLALQAAIAGQGIVLGRYTLVEQDIQNGLLIPLFNERIKANYSYYFVCPEEFKDNPKIEAFYHWMRKKTKQERAYIKQLKTDNRIRHDKKNKSSIQ